MVVVDVGWVVVLVLVLHLRWRRLVIFVPMFELVLVRRHLQLQRWVRARREWVRRGHHLRGVLWRSVHVQRPLLMAIVRLVYEMRLRLQLFLQRQPWALVPMAMP